VKNRDKPSAYADTLEQEAEDDQMATRAVVGVILLVIALAITGVFLLQHLARAAREQGLQNWQARLDLISDSRAEAASVWLNDHLASIEDLASDPSLQLYVAEVAAAAGAASTDPVFAEAERSYAYNLLSAVADRSGFHLDRASDSIAANTRRDSSAGIAAFAADGSFLVATNGTPQISDKDWRTLRTAARPFIQIAGLTENSFPQVLFGAPIYAGEGALNVTNGILGWVIGAKPLGQGFTKALVQPGVEYRSLENYVGDISRETGLMTPLTALKNGGRLLEARANPAARFVAQQPGGFGQFDSYDGRPVLVTGRELVAPVNWVLITSVSADEALAEVEDQRNQLILALSAIGFFLMVVIYFVWRLGVSKRLAVAVQAQAELSARNESLSGFLTSVANSQPTGLAAVYGDLKVAFANARMANFAALPRSELEGRRLDTAFNSEIAANLQLGVKRASNGEPMSSRLVLEGSRHWERRIMRTAFVPLGRGPDDGSRPRALIVMEEITDLVEAQQRSEGLLNQLVSTLTQIIDARDPWSKFHSSRVAEVAVAIAKERDMDDIQLDTVRRAGQLVNLGKIFVPTHILTKDCELTPEELQLVRDSLHRGAELIRPLNFLGPVGETMAQMNICWDGGGEDTTAPHGLIGEAIEPCARVLSVANAFVGMVSARAHRAGISFDAAIDSLHADAGRKYERACVAALQNILENKGGRDRWASFGDTVLDDSED